MKKVLLIMMLGLMFGQTKLETRVYETTVNNQEYFNIYEITGYNLDYFLLEIIDANPLTESYINGNLTISIEDFALGSLKGYAMGRYIANNYNFFYKDIEYSRGLFINNENLVFNGHSDYSWNIKIAVTAEFPEEDTGYIEEGYEYCLNEGFNLVSYPCDESRTIPDAIPNGLTFLNSIIGEGVASQYLDGAGWVGNLTSLQSGDGYWFYANTSTCFQYECSE